MVCDWCNQEHSNGLDCFLEDQLKWNKDVEELKNE